MTLRKPRKRYESGLDYTKQEEQNSKILLKEKTEMLKWTDSIEIKTPNLFIPSQIANHVGSQPFCKFAVSPKADRFALMSHNRQLDVYSTIGDSSVQESSVRVLEDEFAEYCLLEFSASGMLIISTRSSAQIDVFDQTGGYCYDIPLENPQESADLMCAVSCVKTVANNSTSSDDKFLDILYVLQYKGTFSVFKIGRLARYYKMWSVSLDVGLTSAFTVLPEYNLLLVSAHYRASGKEKSRGGLCSFRMVDSAPFVEAIRVASDNTSWVSLTRIPFSHSSATFISSMSLSLVSHWKILAAVATNGDFFLFDIPSTTVRLFIPYVSGPRPLQAIFVDEQELCILYDNGALVRSLLNEADVRESVIGVKSCDTFTSRAFMIAPRERDLFILAGDPGSSALKEVANQRASLACRLWIYTLWSSFKQLVGMAVGDAAAPLQMATCRENLEFTLWHAPTRTLQELFEKRLNEGDYALAKELAVKYDTIDSDVILKREWRDICDSKRVTVDHVHDILRRIEDESWIAAECASCETTCIDVQKELIKLGTSLTSISDAARITLLHSGRILEVCEDIELYLELRDKPCIESAYEFAKRCDMVTLEHLVAQHYDLLAPYALDILSRIPSCLPPSRYEQFLPTASGEPFQIEKVSNAHLEALTEMSDRSNSNAELIQAMHIGGQERSQCDFATACRERAQLIDSECGLIDHAIDLLHIAIEHGFKELDRDLDTWKFYSSYVRLCSLVNEEFSSFETMSVNHLVSNLSKLTPSELIRNVDTVLSLLEWRLDGDDEAVRGSLLPILRQTTEKDTKVMQAFSKRKPHLVSLDMMIECLCSLTITGDDLLRAVCHLGQCSELASALKAFSERNVRPTFRRLWESTTDSNIACGLLTQMASCGQAETFSEWETLKEDVIRLADSLYSKLVSRESVSEIVARELVADSRVGEDVMLLQTMFTLDRKGPRVYDGLKLGWEKSAEIILMQSDELMQESEFRNDPRLIRSRVLANIVAKISPKLASPHLKLLDTIDLVQDLGCSIMPVTIKFTDPHALLNDIVNLKNNYKQGKKCAKLAVLLGIPTPVATALSLCALRSVAAQDEDCLKKYIGEIITKARDIPVVHKLCVEIIESQLVPAILPDIYACALLNSPEENLLSTMECINKSRLSAGRRDMIEPEIGPQLVLDEMYTKVDRWTKEPPMPADVRHTLHNLSHVNAQSAQVACLLSHQSATAALCVSLSESESSWKPWTKNDFLIRYEQALRFFLPQLNEKLVAAVPPRMLMDKLSTLDETVTAMDRLSSYGVDRERFIEDKEYRKETIIGLAMTEEEPMFEDAISLAADFKMDVWSIHMASLENALSSCTIPEAKLLIKSRGHLPVLRGNPTQFHDALRTTVLPLLNSNEQFIAYLSLFHHNEPEKVAAPVLKKLLEKKKELSAKRLFTDENYLKNVLISMPDKHILTIVESILSIPIGAACCESAAGYLLEGSSLRPPASLLVLHALLNKDETALMDLIASKTLVEEIAYLENNSVILAASPNVPASLQIAVRERLSVLTTPSEFSPANPSPEKSVMIRRKH